MSMLSSGIKKVKGAVKGVRKALHLPPITPGNIITKYAPAAVALGAGGPIGAAISKVPMGGAVLKAGGAIQAASGMKKGLPTPTFPTFGAPAMPNPAGGSSVPSAGGDQDWLGQLMGGLGTAAGKVGGYIKDNPLDAALIGLATAQGVNSAKASARQSKLSDEAIALAKQRWAAQAPLRDRGIQSMLNPTTHDLSSVYTDPQNPFAAGMRKPLSPPTARVAPAVPTRPAGPPINRVPTGPTAVRKPLLLPPAKRKLLPAQAGVRY